MVLNVVFAGTFFVFALLSSCTSILPTEASSDEPILLALNQSKSLPRGPVLRFVSVEEDSRCPTGVQCVWAGNARVRIDATFDGQTQRLGLNTTLEPKSGVAFDYSIELLDVMPAATTPSQPESKYSVRLRAGKRGG